MPTCPNYGQIRYFTLRHMTKNFSLLRNRLICPMGLGAGTVTRVRGVFVFHSSAGDNCCQVKQKITPECFEQWHSDLTSSVSPLHCYNLLFYAAFSLNRKQIHWSFQLSSFAFNTSATIDAICNKAKMNHLSKEWWYFVSQINKCTTMISSTFFLSFGGHCPEQKAPHTACDTHLIYEHHNSAAHEYTNNSLQNSNSPAPGEPGCSKLRCSGG